MSSRGSIQTAPTNELWGTLLDEAYHRKSWHGTNLRGSIRGLNAMKAAWKPAPKRKCIADIVLHCAYWKYTVRRRLNGEKRGSFALAGSNWFAVESPLSERTWKDYVRLLDAEHSALREAVVSVSPKRLTELGPGAKTDLATVIRGIILHDVYHTGQIQTLKALQKLRD